MPESVVSTLNRRLLWLIGIRVLVIASAAVPFYLYQLSVPSDRAEDPPLLPGREIVAPVTPGDELEELEDSERRPTAGWPDQRLQAQAEELRERNEQRRRQAQTMKILVAVTSIQTLIYIALLRPLRRRPEIQAYCHFGGDLLLITVLLYELTEAASNFSLLYVFTISVAAVLLRRSVAILVATVAVVLYTLVMISPEILAPVLNWIRSAAALGSPLLPPSTGRMTGVPLGYDLAVHVIGFYGVAFLTSYLAQDATRAEAKLRAQHRDLTYLQVLHEDVLQSISSGLAVLDLEGIITSVNRAGEEVLGLSEQDLIGRHVTELGFLNEERWAEETHHAMIGFKGRSELVFKRGESTLCIGFNITLLRDGDGEHRGFLWIFQDLTDWRELEEQLRIKDRMATIGEMAASLAHEVGNPLASISGSVQMLGNTLEGNPAQTKLLEIILKESRRLDRTLKGFLRMARPRQRQIIEFDVVVLLAEDVALLRNSDEVLPKHRIEAEFEPSSVMIAADPDQISQLFWNLTGNGIQAMPDGGQLTVSGRLDGDLYKMEFRDTGSGMAEEEKAKIFHPFKSFFDKGTGLGMAIVYKIVEEHQGEIHVDSEPGRGTAIRIDLPLRPPESATAVERAS